jgi:hypothetical protein
LERRFVRITQSGMRILAVALGLCCVGVLCAQDPFGDLSPQWPAPGSAAFFPIDGRVTLEDGSPPPEPPHICSNCGLVTPSRDGHFSAVLDGGPRTHPRQCYLAVSLSGFQTATAAVSAVRRRIVIVLLRRGAEGKTHGDVMVSLKMLQAPPSAGRAYGQGEKEMGLGNWAEAEADFRDAVKIWPEHALAWDELGQALEKQGKAEGVREAYEAALAADPGLARPQVHLAGLAIRRRQWAEAAELSDRALRLKPSAFPRAWFYDALASFNLGRLERAEADARRTIENDAEHGFPLAEYVLGTILAKRGETCGAIGHLKFYVAVEPGTRYAVAARRTIAELEGRGGAR